MKRRIISIVCICIMVTTGCGAVQKSLGGDQDQTRPVKKPKVVLLTKSTNSAFWETVYSGANAACTEYNLDLLFEGPENEEDYETQNYMIEQAVKDQVDAIIFSAVDYQASAAAIDQAASQGIKIVVIDSDVNSDKVSCRIGTNSYAAGGTAGKAVLDVHSSQLNIGIVNFDKSAENGQARERGFRDTVAKDSRATIVDSINVLSSIEGAKEETKKMMQRHPEIDVVATFNEWTSLGVGYAIKELELAETTTVVAFDSHVVSVGMLETGEVDALVVQNPYAIGYLGVESAYKLLNGQPLKSKERDTSTILVTKENMYDDESQRALFPFE